MSNFTQNGPITTSPNGTPAELLEAAFGAAVVQSAAVSDAAAATAPNPTAPAAYSAADISATYVEAEVQAIADGLEALRDESVTYEAAISANIVDVADIRTQFNALLAALRTANIIAT